jgi:predicted metal-binding protein
MKHTIQVCTRCNFTKTLEEKEGVRGGAKLMENLTKKFVRSDVHEHFDVQSTSCMGACSHACVVAFQAPGKISWVFGDMNPRFSVPSLIEFAEKYYADERGMVMYADRPADMAAGLIARVHPVGTAPGEVQGKVCACSCDVNAASEDPDCAQ